jgi:hypothetical protein
MTRIGRWTNNSRAGKPRHLGAVLRELGIGYVAARSPQAKGRIERLGATLQDRLVSELRLRGIATVEAAQAYLPEFIADFNRRFGRPPAAPAPSAAGHSRRRWRNSDAIRGRSSTRRPTSRSPAARRRAARELKRYFFTRSSSPSAHARATSESAFSCPGILSQPPFSMNSPLVQLFTSPNSLSFAS